MEVETVLVVDDEPSILSSIGRALKSVDLEVITASSGAEALKIAETSRFGAIICDYGLPDADGIDIIVAARDSNPDMGAALITGYGADVTIVEAFTKGKVDCYLAKPFSAQDVIHVAQLALKEGAIRRREREFMQELERKVTEATSELQKANRLLQAKERETAKLNKELEKDRKRLARLNEKLHRLSITDELSGLFNHRYFSERLHEEVTRVKRYGGPLSVLILDIDNFKQVNDKYGHLAGDEVIRALGDALSNTGRKGLDLPARYGGEEFIIILPGVGLDGASIHAERICRTVENRVVQTGKGPISVTVSVGVSSIEKKGRITPQKLIKEADDALYHAKSIGKNCVVIWQQGALTALGKESVLTEKERDGIADDVIALVRKGTPFEETLRFLCHRIALSLKDGSGPAYGSAWVREGKQTPQQVWAIGDPPVNMGDPEKWAAAVFQAGRTKLSGPGGAPGAGFPLKVLPSNSKKKSRSTVAVLLFERAPANPGFIEEIIDRLSTPLEGALALEKTRQEKDRAEGALKLVHLTHEIAEYALKNKNKGKKKPAWLAEVLTSRLQKASAVAGGAAFALDEGKLRPASPAIKGKRAIIFNAKTGKDAATATGSCLGGLAAAKEGPPPLFIRNADALSAFDQKWIKRFGLSAPLALLPVTVEGSWASLMVVELAAPDPMVEEALGDLVMELGVILR